MASYKRRELSKQYENKLSILSDIVGKILKFESIEDLCNLVRELGQEYQTQEIFSHGNRLIAIIDEAAFTSSTELLGEIMLVLRSAIVGESELMSEKLRRDSIQVVETIIETLEASGLIVD